MDEWGSPAGMRFSGREVNHLLSSIVVLTAAFLIFISGQTLLGPKEFDLAKVMTAKNFAIALGVVVTGFLMHELAHKFAAQIYGYWSEFRASFGYLIASIFISFLGLIFAAPGAVNIVGNVTRREHGVISAVGPLTNLGVAAVMLVLRAGASPTPFLRDVFHWTAYFNLVLAMFNLIPVHPLDGSKVVRWNIGVYLLMLLVIFFEFRVLQPDLLPFL